MLVCPKEVLDTLRDYPDASAFPVCATRHSTQNARIENDKIVVRLPTAQQYLGPENVPCIKRAASNKFHLNGGGKKTMPSPPEMEDRELDQGDSPSCFPFPNDQI